MKVKLLKNLPNNRLNFINLKDVLTSNEYKLISKNFYPYCDYLNDSQLIITIIDNEYYLTLRYNDHLDNKLYVNLTFKAYKSLKELIQNIPETIIVNKVIFDTIEDFLPKFLKLIRYKTNRKSNKKDYCTYHVRTIIPLSNNLITEVIDMAMRKYKGKSFYYGGFSVNKKDPTKLKIMI